MLIDNIPIKPITKKFSFIYILFFKISLIVKGININQTKTHLKKFKDSGGTSNKVANFPIIKFHDQNKAASVSKVYAM